MERRGRAVINGRAFAAVCRGGPWPSRGHCGGARSPTGACNAADVRFHGWPRASSAICLPCQREVPRRQARPEGLPRPEMPPPEAAANRKAIPRSPRSSPLTRGPFVRPCVFIHFPQNQNRAATPNRCGGLVLSTNFLQKRRKNCLIFSKCMVK